MLGIVNGRAEFQFHVSSAYLNDIVGFSCNVAFVISSRYSAYRFAITGDNGDPIANLFPVRIELASFWFSVCLLSLLRLPNCSVYSNVSTVVCLALIVGSVPRLSSVEVLYTLTHWKWTSNTKGRLQRINWCMEGKNENNLILYIEWFYSKSQEWHTDIWRSMVVITVKSHEKVVFLLLLN